MMPNEDFRKRKVLKNKEVAFRTPSFAVFGFHHLLPDLGFPSRFALGISPIQCVSLFALIYAKTQKGDTFVSPFAPRPAPIAIGVEPVPITIGT